MSDISHYEIIEQKVLFGEVAKLDDTQLLALIIRNPKDKAIERGEKLYNHSEKVSNLLNLTVSDIIRVCGVTKQQAISLCALFELIKRVGDNRGDDNIDTIKSNLDVISIFKPIFARLEVEELWALYLTATNKVIKRVKISSGGTASSAADVKLILKNGIELLASSLIILHNHPTDDPTPSEDDIIFTNQLKIATTYLDMRLLDHVILSKNDSYSFLKNRML